MDARAVRWAGLIYAAAIIAGTWLALPSGLTEHKMEWSPASEWMPGVQSHPRSFVASMWVFHVSSVALIAFGVAWQRRWASMFLIGSGAAFLIETTAIMGMGKTGETGALLAFRLQMALLASLLLAAGALVIGTQTWTDRTLPRWLAALALASGVLGALGGLSLMMEPFSFVRTLGVIAWTVFAGLIALVPKRVIERTAADAR